MRPWPTCSSRLVVLNCSLRDLCLPGIVRPRETHLGHDSIANSWGPRSIALDCDEYSCIERPCCCCCCGPTGESERHTKDQKEHTGSKRSVIEGLAPDYHRNTCAVLPLCACALVVLASSFDSHSAKSAICVLFMNTRKTVICGTICGLVLFLRRCSEGWPNAPSMGVGVCCLGACCLSPPAQVGQ